MNCTGYTVGEMEFVSQLTGQLVTESHLVETAKEDAKYFPEMNWVDILLQFYIRTDTHTCGNPAWTGLDQVMFDDMPEEIRQDAIIAS